MSEYGVDLAVWVKQRRVVALLDLIDELPEASRTREAILQDPTLQHVPRDGSTAPGRSWTPPLRSYGLVEQLLRRLINDVNGALGAKGEVIPAPWSAAADQQAAVDAASADAIIRIVTPDAWRRSA